MKKIASLIFFFAPLLMFSQDLTGTWKCNDGATYYIQQNGNDIWWYGNGAPDFCNVFHGNILGSTISGDWSDVPSGIKSNKGSLTLKMVSSDALQRTTTTGNFLGSKWTRGSGAVSTPSPTPASFWEFTQHNGWDGTWVRRGNTNTYEGKLTNGGKTITTVVTIEVKGKEVTVTRTESSNNILVTYKGTIQNDGKTVLGRWSYSGGSGQWTAWIGGKGQNQIPSLARYWEFTQNNGWTGTWTQIGKTNTFDGLLKNGGQRITTVVTIEINGREVEVTRIKSSNKTKVTYKGTIQSDGKTVIGKWSYPGGSGEWTAWMGGK